MTPKEKAQELFDKYYRLFNNFPNYQYVIENLNMMMEMNLNSSILAANIAKKFLNKNYGLIKVV